LNFVNITHCYQTAETGSMTYCLHFNETKFDINTDQS